MPVTYQPRVGEAVGITDWMGEDEWEIDFEDTRGFTAERWATATRLYRLEKADQSLVGDITNHDAFADYLKDTTNHTTNAFQLTSLQSITQIHRPLWQFESLIKEYVEQSDLLVDTSGMWAMAYLNVKLSLESPNKLRRTTRWMTDLRRKIELFNRCVRQCDDQNSMRMEMSEVFSPLLGILHDSITYAQRHDADEDFAKYWPSNMEPKIKDYLDSMENTVKHLQSIGATSKANRATSSKLVELGLRDRDQEKDGAEKALFPVETLPPYPRDCFVGREKEIENIRLRLNSTDPDRLRTYLIYGRRGIGKTQIALEYCGRYRKDYDAIFWVRCETSASLRQSFADIAVALELDGADKNGHFEENLMKVLGWLKRTRKNWLLVYDNAERETLLKGYWPVGARGSILLTSRSFHNFFEDEKRYGETVPFFKEKESWDLLMALLGEKWQKEHLEDSDMLVPLERIAAETLLERTKGLPLAITHAAKLVVNPKISKHKDIPDTSVRGFLELFSDAYKTLPPRPTGDRQQEFHALDTIWSIAFTALTPNARAILGVLALLSPDVTLVDLFLPSDQNRLTEKLEFCRTGTGDLSTRPKLQAAIQPSAALLHAIDELNKAAFIGRAAREMRIHREVQEAVNYQGSKDLTDSFDAAVNLVYDAFPKQELGRPLTDQWDSCRRWVQECIHLANKYWLYKDKSRVPLEDQPWADLLAELLSNCAWYLFEIADYTECLNIVKIGRGTCTDKSSLIYAHLLNTQGAAYYELNQLGPCREAYLTATDIRVEKLPPLHPELAISYSNLGNVEAAKGNLTEALDWFEKAADIREQTPDTSATMLGLNYIQIGRVYFLKSDWERAYELYQRSEGIFNKRIGQNRSYTADLHYAYGNLEFGQKHFIEAARSYEQCRRISMDYNPLHPITSAASYKLACCAFEQDHHRKALNLLDRALEIAEIRSNGAVDGMCARILWKKAEVLLDDPLANRRDEGHTLKIEAELKHQEIAEQLGISLRLNELADDVDREASFDLLVPGYFR